MKMEQLLKIQPTSIHIFMTKKIDIREIHTNFEHILFERDDLILSSSSSSKIDKLDIKLLEIMKSGINSGVAFSERMNSWKPNSPKLFQSLKNDRNIDSEHGKITFFDALKRKIEKERKFRNIQNWSMLICTFLLIIYYMIIAWLV